MGQTFAEILAADRDLVFLNLAEFGETVEWRRKAEISQTRQVVCIFEEDLLEGTNQIDGDGPKPDTQMGSRIRYSATVYLSAAEAVDDRDEIVRNGVLWAVKRMTKSDGAMRCLRVSRVDKIGTRKARTQF